MMTLLPTTETYIDPEDLRYLLESNSSHTFIFLRESNFEWLEAHDKMMVELGFLIRHSCKRNDVWTKDGAADVKCEGCGRLIQPGVLLTIQLKPEQESAMREVLHVRT
ncbi:unnamed protein product [marine sediment metagenome]|uniref:Uncharacterized protein n=1 Tax=marine sediment metagenome TaxID=412755 RepID=X0VJV2_9ZZZZ